VTVVRFGRLSRYDTLRLIVWISEMDGVYADKFIWWLEPELGRRVTNFLDDENVVGPFVTTTPLQPN
jgi:hypothetical protein